MWSYVRSKANPRWLWHAIDHHSGQVLAYVFGRRQETVFLPLQALLEPFGITRYCTDGWGPTGGTSTPNSIGLARTIRRKSRANTSIYGPGLSGLCAAQSVFPRRNTCTIWSLGCSSIAMSLDEPI